MADIDTSYVNADVYGRAAFDVLDNYIQTALLAGTEPRLQPATRHLLGDSLTLAQFSVVGLNSAGKLALATSGQEDAAVLTIGAANAALTFTAVTPGEAGNAITITLLAADVAALIEVSGTDIVVTPKTGENTATEVAALINAHADANDLVSVVAGGTGGSAVGTAAETPLAGGTDEVEAVGVLVHAATSGAANTTKFGETWLTGCFNAGDDSPLVWHVSFDTVAQKVAATVLNPNLQFRSRS